MTETKRPKILVVDDRKENLFAMEKLLESLDVEIFTALSGQEALSLILRHEFALVLLDVQMPIMDGFETAELMQDHNKTQHIPIIFVTAISKERQHVFKGYESGAVDYLFKPIEPEILINKVKVFCELYRQRVLIQEQLDEIKTLRGIIPICASCKKIRDDKGYWNQLESYIRERTEAEFSHGLCPDCANKLYADIKKAIEE